ncbi:hypothetical protein HDU86_001002 [Geranomyces michiganensis]|nr:hypothetical protein HDU86_001002 [Geranomyces michiganensis]
MSDKPFIQEHLADKLAAVVLKLPQQTALRYIDAFWTIISAEWHGIDRLRLDKFYMLLRKFHFYSFRLLESHEWATAVVTEYLNTLTNGPLKVNDFKIADGLRYHTAEVFLEELQRAVTQPISAETLLALLEPFFHNLARTASDVVFNRVRENVFDPILKQKTEADSEDQKLTLPFPPAAVGMRLYAIATGDAVLVKNRPKVTDLFKQFAAVCEDEMNVDHSVLWKPKPVLIKGAKPAALIPPPPKSKSKVKKEARNGATNGVDNMDVDGGAEDDDEVKEEVMEPAERGVKRKAAVAVAGDDNTADKKKEKKKAKKGKTTDAAVASSPAAATPASQPEEEQKLIETLTGAQQPEEQSPNKKKNKNKGKKAADTTTLKVETTAGDDAAMMATVTVDVTIGDVLSETDRAALQELDAAEQLSGVETGAAVSTPLPKTRKALAKSSPRKRPESVVITSADNTDPTTKKAVKFVLDQNKTKKFDYTLPVANQGTPTRKSNISARKVLKPTAPTPVSKKLSAALARAAMLAAAASEAVATAGGDVSTGAETPSNGVVKSEPGATPVTTATPSKSPKIKSPKGSPNRRAVAADLI